MFLSRQRQVDLSNFFQCALDSRLNGANPDQFTVYFTLDVTPKATGKRMTLEEVAIYTVGKDDKITREQFYYEGAH